MKINYLSIFYIMTDNSQNFDSLQEKNQQVLNNISQLQTQEKKLYDSLDNADLSSDQKQQIINKINEISQMRINMYSNMKDMYSFYQKNVAASNSLIGQDVAAIDILETELNNSKQRLNLIQDEKNNKLRLVEINTYYGKQYNAHSKLMKFIIFTCIPIIILSVLANKGILPQNLYAFLTGIIIIIGVVFIGLELIDMSNRDNMNWDEYNWYFNKDDAPSSDTTTTDVSSDPWETTTPSVVCVGAACCYDGSTYDDQKNICVPTAIYNQDTTTTTTAVETFNGLEKYAYTQDKPVSYNNVVRPRYASYKKQ
jgi:hypothetical protein